MNNKHRGKIRIIGGIWKGHLIPVISVPNLRPTSNYLREILFNWLMHTNNKINCLDAFAGTGALGIEALSRGAEKVVFLEKNFQIVTLLSKTLNKLTSNNYTVIQTDTLYWLEKVKPTPFQLVFLDPPFEQALLEPACWLLQEKGWLNVGSYVYLEYDKWQKIHLPLNWQKLKVKEVGQVIGCLYYLA